MKAGIVEHLIHHLPDLQPETFAELIIRETLSMVRTEVAYHIDYDTADRVVASVERYFGIES